MDLPGSYENFLRTVFSPGTGIDPPKATVSPKVNMGPMGPILLDNVWTTVALAPGDVCSSGDKVEIGGVAYEVTKSPFPSSEIRNGVAIPSYLQRGFGGTVSTSPYEELSTDSAAVELRQAIRRALYEKMSSSQILDIIRTEIVQGVMEE